MTKTKTEIELRVVRQGYITPVGRLPIDTALRHVLKIDRSHWPAIGFVLVGFGLAGEFTAADTIGHLRRLRDPAQRKKQSRYRGANWWLYLRGKE